MVTEIVRRGWIIQSKKANVCKAISSQSWNRSCFRWKLLCADALVLILMQFFFNKVKFVSGCIWYNITTRMKISNLVKSLSTRRDHMTNPISFWFFWPEQSLIKWLTKSKTSSSFWPSFSHFRTFFFCNFPIFWQNSHLSHESNFVFLAPKL